MRGEGIHKSTWIRPDVIEGGDRFYEIPFSSMKRGERKIWGVDEIGEEGKGAL